MKTKRIVILYLIALLWAVPSFAQNWLSGVRLKLPENREAAGQLLGLLEIDHYAEDETGSVVVELDQEELAKLRQSGYAYELLVANVADYLDSVNQVYYRSLARENVTSRIAIKQPQSTLDKIIVKPAAFQVKSTFGGYYSFPEMEAAMNALVAQYPAIAKMQSIGKTHENRDIWVIKISDNVNTDEANEPEILYMGLQHAREAITGSSMIFFMQYLCEQYYVDQRIKDLVDNREIFIIPCFNPDGWEYNRNVATGTVNKAGGSWRKNRKPYKVGNTTYYGVDLNRNWSVDWANCSAPINGSTTSCGSSSPGEDTYWGPSAFSEAETQAVRNFVKQHHFIVAFDQHAYGPYYSLPFGRQALHSMPQKGKNFYTAIPALMGTYNGMRAADSYDALGYEVAGGFKDWMLIGELGTGLSGGRKDTVWGMTGEGGAGGGTGGTVGNFWAPASQIVNLSKGMCYQNLQLAFAAGTYVDIEDAKDIALNSTTGTVSFRVKRLGLGNDPVQVTFVPLENIMTNGPNSVTINSMYYYEDRNGSVPYKLPAGIVNGMRIKYAWRVQTGGYTYSDTVIKIYNPQELVFDNMEGTVTDKWIGNTGWGYTSAAAYTGTKSLAESPTGNYTLGTTRTITYKNAVNLSGSTAAYLTFWTRHRIENFCDLLRIEVSTNSSNGTDGSWTPIEGSSTIKEPGTIDGSRVNGTPSITGIQDYWTQLIYDLSPYRNASNFRFRFVFTSDNASKSFKYNQDDGVYIDDLRIVKTTTDLTTLPVVFTSFTGKLIANNAVQLQWSAIEDEMHDYYEVERLVDGNNFTTLGLGKDKFIDGAPFNGINYYRLKQWDVDRKFSYSDVISVTVKSGKLQASVFPIPAHSILNIRLHQYREGVVQVQVVDVQGRTVLQSRIPAGESLHQLNVGKLPAQVYNLKVMDESGNLLLLQKFTKL